MGAITTRFFVVYVFFFFFVTDLPMTMADECPVCAQNDRYRRRMTTLNETKKKQNKTKPYRNEKRENLHSILAVRRRDRERKHIAKNQSDKPYIVGGA